MNTFLYIYAIVFVYMLVVFTYYYRKARRLYPRVVPDKIAIYIYMAVAFTPVINILACTIIIIEQIRELRRPKWV